MNKTIEHLYVIVLFLLLQSCMPAPAIADGAVEGLQTGSALWVASRAMYGSAVNETVRIVKDGTNLTVLGAWMRDLNAWGFICLNGADWNSVRGAFQTGGNLSNEATFKILASDLENIGWKMVPPSQVPSDVTLAVNSVMAGFTSAYSWLANTPVTILVVPAFALPPFMREEPEWH
jgi:hypothetical protein